MSDEVRRKTRWKNNYLAIPWLSRAQVLCQQTDGGRRTVILGHATEIALGAHSSAIVSFSRIGKKADQTLPEIGKSLYCWESRVGHFFGSCFAKIRRWIVKFHSENMKLANGEAEGTLRVESILSSETSPDFAVQAANTRLAAPCGEGCRTLSGDHSPSRASSFTEPG